MCAPLVGLFIESSTYKNLILHVPVCPTPDNHRFYFPRQIPETKTRPQRLNSFNILITEHIHAAAFTNLTHGCCKHF